jgi:hypothetical protein
LKKSILCPDNITIILGLDSMTHFRRKALCAAIGVTFSVSTAPLMAAEVGNFFNAEANSKLKVGVFYSNATRDVEHDGSANIISFSGSEVNPDNQSEEMTLSFSQTLTNLDGEEDNDDIYLKISYALTPKIEVYTKVGFTASELDAGDGTAHLNYSEILTEAGEPVSGGSLSASGPGPAQASDQRTDYGWMLGLGSKVVLFEWASGWNLGLDGQYIYRKQDMDKNFFRFDDAQFELSDHDSHEIQSSLLLGKNTGNFRPYGGLSFTKYKSEYDVDTNFQIPEELPLGIDYFNLGGKLKYENEDEFGFFGGFEYEVNSIFFSFEMRAGDEKGVSLGVSFPL